MKKFISFIIFLFVSTNLFAQDPGGVTGANLWLKANSGAAESGGNLTGWTDQTGTNTFTVTGTPTYTAQGINFNPKVGFSNFEAVTVQPGSYLDGNTSLSVVSGFAVYRSTDAGSGALVGSTTSPDVYGVQYFGGFGANQFWAGNGSLNQTLNYSDSKLSTTSPAAILELSYAAGNGSTSRLNGADKTISFGSASITGFNFTPRIGGTNNQGLNSSLGWNHFRGEVAEIVLYPTSLSNADKLKVESYLAIKYGIHLSADYVNSAGTTIWDATANSTYHNDVFGIGHDDGSGLIQSASNSINTGAGDGNPAVGNGNLYIGSPSDLAEGEFLIVGHNNGSLNEQTTELPLGVFKRIGREWKIDHTGDVGTVTVSFDADGLGLTGNHFRLLIDTDGDGDFTTGTVNGVASNFIVSNRVYFRFVNLPNNSVITFATLVEPLVSASLWLKADAGVTQSSGDLSNWTDQAGHNTFSKTGTVSYTAEAINFNPGVVFQNTNLRTQELPDNRLDGNTEITYVDGFAVYRYTSANTGALIGSTVLGYNYGSAIFTSDADGALWVGNGTNGKTQKFTNPTAQGGFFLANFDVSPTSDPYATGRHNGADQTITPGVSGDFTSINITPMIGGTKSSGSSEDWLPFHGEVGEIVLFPTSLSTSDKQEVESYLAIKYGIHLPSSYLSGSGTTIWDATANSAYQNDVFGIGEEDGSGLNQTQSNSINTGSGDGTGQSGKGNIVLSNASSLDNGDFLLIGNDGAALTETSSDILASTGSSRVTREWKAERTGDVGTVTLTFNTTGLTLSGSVVGDFKMVIDTDGDGDFNTGSITEVAADSYSSNILTFSALTIPDGSVFTFITNPTPLPVELTSFTASLVENSVLLNWETATETNNFGFDVERQYSVDSTQNSEWIKIGFVQGNGTTNSPKYYAFTDSEIPNSEEVSYRLKQIDNDGTFAYSKTVTVNFSTITGIGDEAIPTVYSLEQNYPNPFNPTTTIKFGLPESGMVDLRVYNILGQEVARLVNRELNAGYHTIEFGADNLSSGLYIYRINVEGKFSSIKKMLMIK